MTDVPARHIVAKKLGRRVSRGEYERIFSKLFPIVVPSRRHGQAATFVMHPESPKAVRKHAHSLYDPKGKRARYAVDR